MKTRKLPSLLFLIAIVFLCLGSCQDWGEWDNPAGGQKNPPAPDTSTKLLASFSFEENFNAAEGEFIGEAFAYENGGAPIITDDNERGKVLHQKGGYTRFSNPLKGLNLQVGASISFWTKVPKADHLGALLSFVDETAGTLFFTDNTFLSYEGTGGWFEVNKPEKTTSGAISPNEWHFLVLSFTKEGYTIYIDGEKKFNNNNHLSFSCGSSKGVTGGSFNYSNVIELFSAASYFYLGYGGLSESQEAYFDDVKIYQNAISDKDAIPEGGSITLPTPVYLNTFDLAHTATIVGTGSFGPVPDKGFGTVFKNATGGTRQNYLLLPNDILSHSVKTKELSIGVWVNASNAGTSLDYKWSPLFMAYGAAPVNGENTWPVLACQYRGVVQVNCNGWCDFTDVQNVKGINALYHDATDWLADKKWHYYTVTFTETTAKIYFDGVLKNEWKVDGSSGGSVISGLFSNGADLKYICLGGNQAWNWGDPDPGFMFDDVAIYNNELSKKEIQAIIAAKTVELPKPVYQNTFESGLLDAQIIGTGDLVSVSDKGFGKVFQNAVGGKHQNYLLLPENVLSHSKDSKSMSIAVWVNASQAGSSATYMWSPLFTAYGAAPVNGENTWPMLALQYRGTAQVNCAGWCDFTDIQNVKGANTLYHDAMDWLADKKWHYYTATFTETTAKIYFDGVLKNEWKVDGSSGGSVISGLFSNGADLKYICLGGNQAWNWGDPDPGFMFDDIAIFNFELTESQITTLMSNK